MLLADDGTGQRTPASPGEAGWCPLCQEQLIAKCGEIVTWHWAHHAQFDCDPWSEPESDWHADWKRLFQPEQTEVTVGSHRADIITNGTVIELQHQSLAVSEIRERERFYRANVGAIVWVFDASSFTDNVDLRPMREHGRYGERGRQVLTDPRVRTFRWRWPRKSHATITMPLYWDLGDDAIFRVRRVYPDCPSGGWGQLGTKAEFLDHFRKAPIDEREAG
jgi:hypothetical protein